MHQVIQMNALLVRQQISRARLNKLEDPLSCNYINRSHQLKDMPYYSYKGGALAWFASIKSHIGLYLRALLTEEQEIELAKSETTKSTVRFPRDEELPISLIKKLVKARMEMNEQAENYRTCVLECILPI
jgi:uncharacterized protein YdhG (YjbR/CyaY superfamily)